MASEMIDRIRSAEKEAAGCEQEAKQKARELLDDARRYADELMEKETEAARSEGMEGLRRAEEEGRKAADDSTLRAQGELAQLEKDARARMEDAVQTVLRELLN